MDTKVSIIMAALGVVIAGIINCRNLIMDTYNIVKVDETKCMNTYCYSYVFVNVNILRIFLGNKNLDGS